MCHILWELKELMDEYCSSSQLKDYLVVERVHCVLTTSDLKGQSNLFYLFLAVVNSQIGYDIVEGSALRWSFCIFPVT